MTAPGGLGKSLGDAAGRGAILVGVAVLLGLLLLRFGLNGDDDGVVTPAGPETTEATDDGGSDDGSVPADDSAADDGGADASIPAADGTEPTVAPPPPPSDDVAHPPNEVLVMTANGTDGAVAGLAGTLASKLGAANYATDAANAQATATSKIYYREGYSEDARLVAELLGAPPNIIQAVPEAPAVASNAVDRAAAANIIVIAGTDGLISE